MKFRASYLFYFLTILIGGLLISTKKTEVGMDVGMQVEDRHYTISYSDLLVPVGILFLVTALIYSFMERKDKPINMLTAVLHFLFMTTGLFLSLTIYREAMITLIMTPDDAVVTYYPRIAYFLIGPSLAMVGMIVFVYGIFKALWTTRGKVL